MRQEFESNPVIGQVRQPGTVPVSRVTTDIRLLREEAFDLISRFRSLLDRSQNAEAEDCRQILEAIDKLSFDVPATLAELEIAGETGDASLIAALRDVSGELSPLTQEIQQQLYTLQTPRVSRFEETAAFPAVRPISTTRKAARTVVSGTVPSRLEIPMKRSSASGVFLLVFGIGWLSFTTFHATLMIGGFSRAIGPAAFFLLAFYSIFYLVGFGMLWAGVNTFRTERITLEGRTLTVHYNLFGFEWDSNYTLDERSRAWIAAPNVQQRGNNALEIAVLTGEGKEIRMGNGMSPPLLEEEMTRINEYLQATFRQER